MAKRFGWLLAVWMMSFVQPALADDLAQARATFTLGDEHFSASRYQEACDAFESVLKVVEVPAVAYKAGLANEKLGRLVRSSELYSRATQLKPNQFWADKQTQLKAQREARAAQQAVNGRIPTLTLEFRGDVSEIAVISIDDVKLSREALSTPQRLDPGNHVLRTTMKNGRSLTEAITLAESESKTVNLDLSQTIAPANLVAAPDPVVTLPAPSMVTPPSGHVAPSKLATDASQRRSAQQWIGYASLGVGAAGFLVGATAGIVAWSKYSDMKSQCGGSRDCAGATYDRLNPPYESWQTASTVGFVVAGIGAAAGVTLLLLHPREEAAPRVSLTVRPDALMLSGAF